MSRSCIGWPNAGSLPSSRFAELVDVTPAVIHLKLGASIMINGQVLVLDGGFMVVGLVELFTKVGRSITPSEAVHGQTLAGINLFHCTEKATYHSLALQRIPRADEHRRQPRNASNRGRRTDR